MAAMGWHACACCLLQYRAKLKEEAQAAQLAAVEREVGPFYSLWASIAGQENNRRH